MCGGGGEIGAFPVPVFSFSFLFFSVDSLVFVASFSFP